MSELRATKIRLAVKALENDLLDESGPKISTLRNYAFAILVYSPSDEWEMRREVANLTESLKAGGWYVHTVDMQGLMMRRLREFFTPEELEDLIQMEEELSREDGPKVGLERITEEVYDALHGPDGIAALLAKEITNLPVDEERRARTVVFVGQLGALYPFTRTSALLKFLDGKTGGTPVVFLYPGSVKDGGLSFLDEGRSDLDYRPRIYTHESPAI